LNPLYIDSTVISLSIKDHSLLVMDRKNNKAIEEFKPREIPYDSIVLQRGQGWISLAAINWLVIHNISVSILNWKGQLLAQILPEQPISNDLKIAQYTAYLDEQKRLSVAKTIIETKERRQREFLVSLGKNYDVSVPVIHPFALSRLGDMDYLRGHEATCAV